MRRRRFSALALAAALVLPLAATEPGPASLTYLTEDYPSSNYLENGQLKGIAVDLIKALWRELGVPEQPIQVINWARGFQQVERTPGTVLFAMTRSAQRENLFQWVGPIYRGRYVLFARADRRFKLNAPRDAARHTIGVLREDVGDRLMVEAGVPQGQLERVGHVRQLVRMLEAGRVDLICLYKDTLLTYAAQERLDLGKFASELVVSEVSMFYAFNKATDPNLVRRFQAALDRIDPERRRIVKRYGGTP